VLIGIIGAKKEQATESWSKMHNDKFHSLYSLEKAVGIVK
jgi:hypothetical protein